ncbi:hypothetical protein SBI_01129 [Streptomyces bingchenggensis BCW-1]|uniref:Uncharacterized protein n=1 Tax=Streptomyces bingchenggensis (strain BCW-1) TaxID=749414 RepID=D7C889_STRBB|nr:hypothetical protein SBI_01129 [Streptomyces bingchenggensis BCW-1]
MFSMWGMCGGRPAVVAPKVMSCWPVVWLRRMAQAVWMRVLRVVLWWRAVVVSWWVVWGVRWWVWRWGGWGVRVGSWGVSRVGCWRLWRVWCQVFSAAPERTQERPGGVVGEFGVLDRVGEGGAVRNDDA